MISKNVLLIQSLAFNLPDDFDGNLTDALEELIKYRRSQEAEKNREIYTEGKQDPLPNPDNCYMALEQLCQLDNDKLRGSFLLLDRNYDKNEYEPIYDKWRYK